MRLLKNSIIFSVLMLVITVPSVAMSQSGLDEKAKKAVQSSDVDLLARWIKHGGDINQTSEHGNTLLIEAAKIGDKRVVDFLLSKQPEVNHQNDAGATALMIAAKYGHRHVVEILLRNGADPTLRNEAGSSAAQFALAYGHQELLQKLEQAMLTQYRDGQQVSPSS